MTEGHRTRFQHSAMTEGRPQRVKVSDVAGGGYAHSVSFTIRCVGVITKGRFPNRHRKERRNQRRAARMR